MFVFLTAAGLGREKEIRELTFAIYEINFNDRDRYLYIAGGCNEEEGVALRSEKKGLGFRWLLLFLSSGSDVLFRISMFL